MVDAVAEADTRLYPYPDRGAARRELERDPVYRRILPEDVPALVERAWQFGAGAARDWGRGRPARELLRSERIDLELAEDDPIVAGSRRFGEYDHDANRVVLHMGSLARWAAANATTLDKAAEIAMAHEFFHYLECARIGPASRLYEVRLLHIGGWTLLRSGVRALSEIGAFGFSHTCLTLCRDAALRRTG